MSYRDNFPMGEPDYASRPEDERSRAEQMLHDNVVNGELVVPAGNYFAMGDNRDNSLDSRYWGLVPRENIIGKPLIIFWSYDAPTEDLKDYNVHHLVDLAQHFFTKTRWNRTLKLVHGYPLGEMSRNGQLLRPDSGRRPRHALLAAQPPQQRQAGARFVGDRSLIQQTVDRLRPVLPPERIWILTNDHLRAEIVRQFPEVPKRQILAEPAQRNTAPAIGLAAHILQSHRSRNAVMGVFPVRSHDREARRISALRAPAFRAAADGKIVVLGIQPRWPETGYGYIEFPKASRSPVPANRCRCASFARSPIGKPPRDTCAPEISIGTRACSSGRRRCCWTRCASFQPKTATLLASLPAFRTPAILLQAEARLPQLREHFDRLRRARKGAQRSRIRHRRFRLERCGQLERRLRTAPARRERKRLPRRSAGSNQAPATTWTPKASWWRCWA